MVSFYGKSNRLAQVVGLNEKTLDKVYADSADTGAREAFMGAGVMYIISQELSPKVHRYYLIYLEKSGKRFQISPLEEVGDGWCVQARYSHISRDEKILNALTSVEVR